MKRIQNRKLNGITRIELIVVICVLAILASMIVPAGRGTGKIRRISCINNLKEIGTAYRIWANDYEGTSPWQTAVKLGGMRELVTNSDSAGRYAFLPFGIMREELGRQTKTVICPADTRLSTSNFTFTVSAIHSNPSSSNEGVFGNSNVSYFTGLAGDILDANAIIAGDRNLDFDGMRNPWDQTPYPPNQSYRINGEGTPSGPTGADALIDTNGQWISAKLVGRSDVVSNDWGLVGWSANIHSRGKTQGWGDILLGDGSACQISSVDLRIRLKPGASHDTNGLAPSGVIRLLFP